MNLLDELKLMQDRVRQSEPISPSDWLDFSDKINVLRAEYDDKLWEIGQMVAKKKVELIESGKSVAQAKAITEATDEYKQFNQLKALLERVTESIRLGKIRARGAGNEYQYGK